MERENIDFYKKVREGYLVLAKGMPERFIVVDGTKTEEAIEKKIWAEVKERLELSSVQSPEWVARPHHVEHRCVEWRDRRRSARHRQTVVRERATHSDQPHLRAHASLNSLSVSLALSLCIVPSSADARGSGRFSLSHPVFSVFPSSLFP